ncbi:MAG: Nramp family divalent metal transporter [Candidatus Buchananbacteria bacterium]|nr:Nramp family divalent metal transporter [Candidatus Buchananbacteria bacterium]
MDAQKSTTKKPFPKPIKFTKLLGPSFIILALGLGSGEVILWPYLTSNWGLGIAWGALLGITFQFFMNMEIERYALARGESVFVGFNKMFKWAAYWFIISTFIGFGLPGIIAASAQVVASLFGVTQFKWLAILFLIIIGLILSSGKTVYGMMEKITKTIIFLGIPLIIVLAIILASGVDWLELLKGLVGQGQNYSFLPSGIAFATFFAAFAYAGAGGNLNLTQSIYVKEKGYGMGAYAQKISGLFKNLKENQQIKLEGQDFDLTEDNLKNFKAWWKKINLEHLSVFWFCGFLAMSLLMLLSYTTTFSLSNNAQGINFVINEGSQISQLIHPIIGIIFLVVVGIMLFQTQLGILDSTSRIMAENFALKRIDAVNSQDKKINLSKIYFAFLWAQIIFGITLFLFGLTEPKFLIVLGAVINAVSMFVHVGMTTLMNRRLLPIQLRPAIWRMIIMVIIFVVFGIFSVVTVWDTIAKFIF